jgi:hypothetical protein
VNLLNDGILPQYYTALQHRRHLEHLISLFMEIII